MSQEKEEVLVTLYHLHSTKEQSPCCHNVTETTQKRGVYQTSDGRELFNPQTEHEEH